MSDYISREAVIDAIGEVHPLDYNGQSILERVKNLPSAEKTGKWILHGEPPWKVRECSECGEKWHHWTGYDLPNFCGNCGARMVDE